MKDKIKWALIQLWHGYWPENSSEMNERLATPDELREHGLTFNEMADRSGILP